jgi:GrpB-like predicted nucleotidyltransferase (UPF0157 family)
MITIVPYDPAWPSMFEAEAASIRHALGRVALQVEHVGSTSVRGMGAKPVIDIQVSVPSLEQLNPYLDSLARIGYTHVPVGTFDLVYPFFQKPAVWPTTHHVHLCVAGSEYELKHLAFRDYLRKHPSAQAQYATLKHQLAAANHGTTFESRERYSLSKSEFVASVLERAFAEGYSSPRHNDA